MYIRAGENEIQAQYRDQIRDDDDNPVSKIAKPVRLKRRGRRRAQATIIALETEVVGGNAK